jgi:hypothetical protein
MFTEQELRDLVNNHDGSLHDLATTNNWSQVASYNDGKTSGISFAPSIAYKVQDDLYLIVEYQSFQIVNSLQAAKDAVK